MQRYSRQQITFHWLSLFLIAVTYAVIELKGFIPKSNAWHNDFKLIHFNAGVLVFVVMAVRIYLYNKHELPNINPEPPQWQQTLASWMHKILYLCFFSLPVLGVVGMIIGGKQWDFLGIHISALSNPNKALYSDIKVVHEYIANAGYFLIGIHALAAIYHHHIVKDDTLKRMV
ncbi:cytochrome b [Vibrio marisflavi]|uniref:Cytochrome b561 n=1 Tax=Vibrio marisflavi CECT 7928 TaxID=634439 RepID=A0ABM9A8P4_9VIBR|nr:cytochrome b [Vibrio marisflavi]CAH0542076.1 Cytochrome b561 [Vibrio marisflavi CECT 7928]